MAYYKCGQVYVSPNSNVEIATASGAIATFNTSLALPLVSLIVDIQPQQASGTPTPSAPLPISGTDEFVITHTGKNLLDYSHLEWTSGIRNDEGTPTPSSASHYTNPIKVNPDTSYNISGTLRTSATSWAVYFLDKNGGWISRISGINATTTYTFTTPVNCGYIQLQCVNSITYNDTQLETGTTGTTYEAYTATTETITLPSTVYGGWYDVTTGKLTVTHIKYTLSSSTNMTISVSGDNTQRITISDYSNVGVKNTSFVSSHYPMYDGVVALPYMLNSGSAPRMWICFPLNTWADLNAFKNYCDAQIANGTPIEIAAEIATPIEYTLTPTQIKTRGGTESIFADCGDVELQYKKIVT